MGNHGTVSNAKECSVHRVPIGNLKLSDAKIVLVYRQLLKGHGGKGNWFCNNSKIKLGQILFDCCTPSDRRLLSR
jgi:hypothetical protein